MEYNIVTVGGKEAYIIKNKTSFKVVKELLETDYLGTVIKEFIEQKCVHNPNLTKGVLVSNRRSLKAKLAKERLMSDVVMNRFLEQEIPKERYDYLQQYIGSIILSTEGAENIELNLGRGVNEEYFRKKGIKLAKLNLNAKWRLVFVKDIIFGHCSLGHEIRYAFTAMNDMGDSLIFGSTCVNDFFEIDEQLTERLGEYVNKIRSYTEEYYNDYHAYYEIHAKQDQFMALLVQFINKLTNDKTFNNQEISYLSTFVGWGMPVPGPLAMKLGNKIMNFLNKEFKLLVAFEPFDVVVKLIYLCGCFAYGSHGTTINELRSPFPVNFLGDRIMPKGVEDLIGRFEGLSTGHTKDDFVSVMSSNLDINKFVNILNNMYLLKDLTRVLAEDDDLVLELNHAETGYKLTYKEITLTKTHTAVKESEELEHAKRLNLLFNFPMVTTREEALKVFMTQKLQLKKTKSVLNTVDLGYISMFEYDENASPFGSSLSKGAKKLSDFIVSNDGKVKASDIVMRILHNDFVNKDKLVGQEWFTKIVQDNNIGNALREKKEESQSQPKKEFPTEEYEELLEKAIRNRDIVEKQRLGFAVDILKTTLTYKRISPKQQKFVEKLGVALKDV
ncbi:hypothetical protein COF68_05660 [Bacillus toyonensis]|uniref:hypothetical protein n=1 Tax=Bacillus toyonensis TaxID=155322 RepID=UPI000BFBA7D3|nr:hypothetical protein [Bacillus toyonensis]PHE64328.1 hypothetical protein COF68_05660 [Bacillus toyonensis]